MLVGLGSVCPLLFTMKFMWPLVSWFKVPGKYANNNTLIFLFTNWEEDLLAWPLIVYILLMEDGSVLERGKFLSLTNISIYTCDHPGNSTKLFKFLFMWPGSWLFGLAIDCLYSLDGGRPGFAFRNLTINFHFYWSLIMTLSLVCCSWVFNFEFGSLLSYLKCSIFFYP